MIRRFRGQSLTEAEALPSPEALLASVGSVDSERVALELTLQRLKRGDWARNVALSYGVFLDGDEDRDQQRASCEQRLSELQQTRRPGLSS